ncbi:MAG: SDR family NAD(P)-dependent oxidoreductase [Planctomycetes bacterium]|nr:SDR family NAD(P)-dependent oxidoreductase [Planctomycetota bacterium]
MKNADEKRVAVITGASRGFGRELALAFAGAGYDIAAVCKERTDLLAGVAGEVGALGVCCRTFRADQSLRDNADALAGWVGSEMGRADVLVCNAGIVRDKLILRLSEEDWDAVIDVNLTGTANIIRAFYRLLKESVGQVLIIGSYIGLVGRAGQASYSASKAGLIGLGKTLAREFGPKGIRVNTVLPGYLPTGMGLAAGDNVMKVAKGENLLDDLSYPEEVAAAVVKISEIGGVSGQVFNLDSRIIPS